MIPLFKSFIHEEAINRATAVLWSGWPGLGPITAEFEKEFAAWVNSPYAIAFNSGTAALQAAVTLAELPEDSFVISTPITFVSTNHVILQAGLKPLFADIDYNTGSISTSSIRKLLEDYTGRVSAIMIVHYGGAPADLNGIYDLAEEHGITVIEDAAHACGASYQGNPIGCKWSKFTCFSFHAVKPLPIGEGGMLTTNDANVAEKAKRLRWLGISKSTADRFSATGTYSWKYDCNVVGFKSHMSDYQAAIGLGQLHHMHEFMSRRAHLVELYMEYLRRTTMRLGLDFCVPVLSLKETTSANHLMAVQCLNTLIRDYIMNKLKESDIQTGVHYAPNYLYPMYWRVPKENNCVKAEMFWRRELTLPLHLGMTDEDVRTVCDLIDGSAKELGYGT